MQQYQIEIKADDGIHAISAVIDADSTAHAIERAREIYTFACGPLPVGHACSVSPVTIH